MQLLTEWPNVNLRIDIIKLILDNALVGIGIAHPTGGYKYDKLTVVDRMLVDILEYFVLGYVIKTNLSLVSCFFKEKPLVTPLIVSSLTTLLKYKTLECTLRGGETLKLFEMELPYWLGFGKAGNWLCIGYMAHYLARRQLIDFCMPVARPLIASVRFICYSLLLLAHR